MIEKAYYQSPVGKITLASRKNKLIGLWIEGQKYGLENLKEEVRENQTGETLERAKSWLNRYFKRRKSPYFRIRIGTDGE